MTQKPMIELSGDAVQDLLEWAARTAHEVNRAYCVGLGDDSQVPWDEAPGWQRESALNGVRAIVANPQTPASASHDNWLREKVEAGWVWGEVKDPEKKQHPCIVPFDQLPPSQQTKDILFGAVVRGVLGI